MIYHKFKDSFEACRVPGDLKDRYRTLEKNGITEWESKAKKEIANAVEDLMKNGRKAIKGKFPTCGVVMFKILGVKATPKPAEPVDAPVAPPSATVPAPIPGCLAAPPATRPARAAADRSAPHTTFPTAAVEIVCLSSCACSQLPTFRDRFGLYPACLCLLDRVVG